MRSEMQFLLKSSWNSWRSRFLEEVCSYLQNTKHDLGIKYKFYDKIKEAPTNSHPKTKLLQTSPDTVGQGLSGYLVEDRRQEAKVN